MPKLLDRLDGLMERRVPVWAVATVLVAVVAAGWLVAKLALSGLMGETRFLPWSRYAAAIMQAPTTAVHTLGQIGRSPYQAQVSGPVLPAGLWRNTVERVIDDGMLLAPVIDPRSARPVVQLVRLSDGKVLKVFRPDLQPQRDLDRKLMAIYPGLPPAVDTITHPELLEDGSVVFNWTNGMARSSPCDKLIWASDRHHHSLERDDAGQIWAPTVMVTPLRDKVSGTFGVYGEHYREDGISSRHPDGALLLERSLWTIFKDNGLEALIEGRTFSSDPFHLNDIEPIMRDGPNWKRGDLFLSMRHLSLVMLYRPSTGKVLWWKIGPWQGQHDVTVLDDNKILILDNHLAFHRTSSEVEGQSRALVYDFADGSVHSQWQAAFDQLKLSIPSNGRATPLPDGDLIIEDSVEGVAWRVAPDGQVRWRFVNGDDKGNRFVMYWARYLPAGQYDAAIQAALEAKC